ncbi:MAG TPA: helix-turn-helix transcriptional regulator [Anaerolineales bacterium]|nr:helix-turn-helix transcriptional regulator [Anaerolineales bacterium]
MTTTLGLLIRAARQAKGLTQTELAKKLGYSTPQYISNVECGKCSLASKKVIRTSKLLGISLKTMRRLMIKDYEQKLIRKGLR